MSHPFDYVSILQEGAVNTSIYRFADTTGDGSLGEYISVDLNDNFTGMVEHYFMFQGTIEPS